MRWACVVLSLLSTLNLNCFAQDAPSLKFDVASVRQNRSDGEATSSNVPLGPGNVYVPTAGAFNAKNLPLMVFIEFAYRMNDAQEKAFLNQVPDWVKNDRFDILARTEKIDATKDDLRLMMRSLLAERFALQVHTEKKEMPVFELERVAPDSLGPGLRLHPAQMSCAPTGKELKAEWPEALPGGFPALCGAILGLPARGEGNYRLGASNVTVAFIAASLAGWGALNKPVIDQSGIKGAVDFVVEYAPQERPETDASNVASGQTFQEALKRQLGLRLRPGRGAVELFALDHIHYLTDN